MSDTQDTRVERLDPEMPAQEMRLHMGDMLAQEMRTARAAIRWANSQAATALADRDAKIAEMERERDEAREGDAVATSEMQHWRGLCEKADGEIGMLRADFNDCNSERIRWRERTEAAEAQVAELTQKLERATAVIDKLLDAALSNQSTASLKEGEEVVTDDDRAAYWKGAYDRMSARNIEQSNALDIAERALDDLANGRGLSTPIEKIIRDIQATAGRSM